MSSEVSDSALRGIDSQWINQLAEGSVTEETAAEEAVAVNATADHDQTDGAITEQRIPNGSEGEFELPQPLRRLITTGNVKLVAVPDSMWNIDGYAAKLCRTLSVSFSVDQIVSSKEVVKASCNTGVAAEEMNSV